MRIIGYAAALMLCITLAVAPAVASGFTLGIYGNANMDVSIDEKDVAYLEGVIKGVNAPTNLSDANYDSKIDAKDIDQIEKIIRGEETELTVLDLANRTVTIEMPVEKVVLASARDLHEFASVCGGTDFYKKIVGWGSDLKDMDKDTYRKYSEKFPEIADIPDIGYHYSNTFNVEKIISLKPDVVLMPWWIRETAKEDVEKLARAGIPTVYINFLFNPDYEDIESILLLGWVLGKEDRAQDIVDFYQEQVNEVYSRMEKIKKAKPTVYVECGSKEASEYGNSYGSYGWGAMVEMCGGVNIAKDLFETTGTINPEYLLNTNPDVIMISGSYWPAANGSMRLGYYADRNESLEILKTFTERPGWNTLDAVKNHKVYSIFHGFSFRVFNFAGIQALARCIYPEEFKDLDPEKSIKEFHERFMPVDYSGVWMISLEE